MSEMNAEDRAEIVELFAGFAWAAGTGDVESFVALFTPDGAYDGVDAHFEGRDGLAMLVAQIDRNARSKGMQHWVSNSVFDGDASVAL